MCANLTKSAPITIVQAVIFDLDGVLINSEWLAFKAWQDLAQQRGGRLPDDAFTHMAGISAEATADYVMQRAGVTFDPSTSVDWIWREMAVLLKTQAQPMAGAVALVQELARRGYPLAIASNSISPYIENALGVLGLLDYFPVRASIDQVPQGKPAPDVYLVAAERLGVDPQRCLAVEDSRTGVQAAAAAGLRVIAVPGENDTRDGFKTAWKIYPSLVQVYNDLDTLLGDFPVEN